MGTANQAYGNAMFPPLPFMEAGAGVKTPYGLLLPPSPRVAGYVCSNTSQWYTGSHEAMRAKTFTTLAAGLKSCRAGLGDTLIVLPGHSENVADATMFADLAAGTNIIGATMDPQRSDAPTFTWTATGSQWTLDQADVCIANLKLDFTGVDSVDNAIAVSAARCTVTGCHMVTSTGSAQADKIFDPTADADYLRIVGNVVEGTADAVADFIDLDVVVDRVFISNNEFVGGFTNGFVNVAAAATNLRIYHNIMHNIASSSTACITVADVASTGIVAYNSMACLSGGTSAAEGVVVTGTSSLLRFVQNFNTSDARASGILAPAVAD